MAGKLVLLTGRCATGKSTFARRLAGEVGVPCFLKDEVKEVLGEGFGPESGEVYEKGSRVTFRLLAYLAEQVLEAGGSCILEGNFKEEELEVLQKRLEKHRGGMLHLLLYREMETLYRRYRAREADRHWVHRSMDRGLEAFAAGQSRLPLTGPGKVLLLDTTNLQKWDDSVQLSVIKRIKDFLQDP